MLKLELDNKCLLYRTKKENFDYENKKFKYK